MELLFSRLSEYGVVINPAKCQFGATNLDFLGHHIDEQGIHPLDEKITTISEFPRLTSVRQLRRFLGLINFYQRFLPHCVAILAPLTDLLRDQPERPRKPTTFTWSEKCETAFSDIKLSLANITMFVHPSSSASLSLIDGLRLIVIHRGRFVI